MKPLGARAIVRRIVPAPEAGKKIILPDAVKERHRWGEVVALGEKEGLAAPGEPIDCEKLHVGDRVLLPKMCHDVFDHEGEELLVLEYRELLAVKVRRE